MPTVLETPQLLDSDEVAALLRVKRGTILKWNARRRLPRPVPVPGRLKWDKADLLAFIRGERQAAPAGPVAPK
jgi:predicted DNA-binding transcriptional regulator AlpA